VPGGERLLKTPHFALYRFPLRGGLTLRPEAPLILTLLEGEAWLPGEVLRPPATFLLFPGEEVRLQGEGLFLGATPGLDQSPEGRED
jgi:mannose-6-phosphate isomerase